MTMRNQYAVRVSLDESRLSTPVDLFSADSVFQIKREVTARTFLMLAVACIGLVWIFTHSYIQQGGFFGIGFFLLGYCWSVALLAGVTPDNRDGYQLLKPMYEYLFSANRDVSTQPLSDSYPASTVMSDITGFNKKRNLIEFGNGDIGQIFELSGNASLLSFDSDLSRTIDSAQRFFSSVNHPVTLVYDNNIGPQRVVEQVAGKNRQIDNLSPIFDTDIHQPADSDKNVNEYTVANNNIRNLMYAQREVLEDYIGKEFQSLRQYVLVRSINRDNLHQAVDWLATQQSDSGDTYIKSARMLNYDETVEYLRQLFTDADVTIDADNRNEG